MAIQAILSPIKTRAVLTEIARIAARSATVTLTASAQSRRIESRRLLIFMKIPLLFYISSIHYGGIILLVLELGNDYHNSMVDLPDELSKIMHGDVDATDNTRAAYSHDASIYEIKPQVVVYPKDSADVKSLVAFVTKYKKDLPNLSITPRTKGTDMSGGAINDSIILDGSRYLTATHDISTDQASVQPGVMYKDFEKKTLVVNAIMPSYPASRELAGIGGMVNNNAGGENSLEYGKTERYVMALNEVLADGNEYDIKPLTRGQLNQKMESDTFEGHLYRELFKLLDQQYDEIKSAKPRVGKDSTGYHLWDIWDRESGVFDLTKLFVGSQGTLGITTDVTFRLVPKLSDTATLLCFMDSLDVLGDVIPAVLSEKPTAFECFDDATFRAGFPKIASLIGLTSFAEKRAMRQQLSSVRKVVKKQSPHLVLLIKFTGKSVRAARQRAYDAEQSLKDMPFYHTEVANATTEQAFWAIRHASFHLLGANDQRSFAAPFIDDIIVPPTRLSAFLPRFQAVLKKYQLRATVAGHIGEGNFHVIPLMDLSSASVRDSIQLIAQEVNELVLHYGGSISGEHNDGLVRGPWLERQYSANVYHYFKEVKQLFDPLNIFNPHKKTNATIDYGRLRIRQKN